MLHLAFGGGKLPRNSTLAFAGRNGSNGWFSIVILRLIFLIRLQ